MDFDATDVPAMPRRNSRNLKSTALEFLRDLGPAAEPSAKVVGKFLNSEDGRLRGAALQVLENLGAKAAPARSALEQAGKNEDPITADSAARILKLIVPAAGAGALKPEERVDLDAPRKSPIAGAPKIAIQADDYSTPEKVYALYCRAMQAGDLRAAQTCLGDDAEAKFTYGAVHSEEKEFDEALKTAATVKPGKLVRSMNSPNGSRVVRVYEEEGSLLGAVFRKSEPPGHWIISTWQGDWQRPPTDDPAAGAPFQIGFINAHTGAETLGLARMYGLAPGATTRWYGAHEFEDNEITIQMKRQEFNRGASLLDEKSERLAGQVIPLPAQGWAALLLHKQDQNKKVTLWIRVVDLKTNQTVWEKPWPGTEPEEMAFAMGAAGLFEDHGDLLARVQEAGEDALRFDVKTGDVKKPAPGLSIPEGRAEATKLGTLPDGHEVWLSAAKDAREKLKGIQDFEEAERLLDRTLHLGKPGEAGVQHIPLKDMRPENETGWTQVFGLSPDGLLVGVCMHKDKTATLFGHIPGEKTCRWTLAAKVPLLDVTLLGARLLIQYGKVTTMRQPVMVSFTHSQGVEMLSAKDGKMIYQLRDGPNEPNAPALKRAAGVSFLRSVGDIDLYQGFADENDTRVWLGVEEQSGKVAWQSTEAHAESIAAVDEDAGEVYAISDLGQGVRFDAKTGLQSAVLSARDFGQRDRLVRSGGVWLIGEFKVNVEEKLLTARVPPALR